MQGAFLSVLHSQVSQLLTTHSVGTAFAPDAPHPAHFLLGLYRVLTEGLKPTAKLLAVVEAVSAWSDSSLASVRRASDLCDGFPLLFGGQWP